MNLNFTRQLFSIILIAFLCNTTALAQQKNTPTVPLVLVNRPVSPEMNLMTLESAIQQAIKQHHSAQFYLQIDQAHLSNQLSGIFEIQDQLKDTWVLARFTESPSEIQLQQSGITAWSAVQPHDKISKLLVEESATGSSTLEVLVSVDSRLELNEVSSLFTSMGISFPPQQSWKSQSIWQLEIGEQALLKLAKHPLVRYISPVLADEAIAFQAKGFTNTQVAQQALALGGHNLTGAGVTIGVGDDSDPYHVDFDDRMNSMNPMLFTTHGFHTTGTVGGAGIRDPLMRGYAPSSQLISDYFSQVIANTATYIADFGMSITNNSYGTQLHNCAYMGTYDLYSQILDQQMRDHDALLHVFAAANDGTMTCSPYPPGFATVTGAYSTAKNVLTVGSNGKTRDILSLFSSRGPTKDGRLKPEITAVGTRLYSTVDHNNYALNSGTSMACPNVAGAAGLLYERYKQLHSGENPKGSLIKTLLMNGADDLGNIGPDFRFGFGLMNVGHSLRMLDSSQYFTDTINTEQIKNFNLQIPANIAEAKIMLYWNDAPAAPLSAQTLVNNLDLQIISPSGNTLLPWVLNPDPNFVDAPASIGVDTRNNVEQITINQPAAGSYTIKILGQNVPVNQQEFVVAYDFIPFGLRIQYPFGGEALPNTDSLMIYWEASSGNQSFELLFSADNGNTWQSIQNNVPADKRAFIWFLPQGISSNQCLVRVSRNGTGEISTSKPFTLSTRPVVSFAPLEEQCPGSLKITWSSIPGANGYAVFQKQGANMMQVASTTALNYTFSGLQLQDTQWVSVAPIINGSTGIRALAISKQADSGTCATAIPGDLHLLSIDAPVSGREWTERQLGSHENLSLHIQNQDAAAATQYRISYRVNGGSWQSQIFTNSIPPAGSAQIQVGSLNLSDVGMYTIDVAVTNLLLSDPFTGNDSLSVIVYQLPNEPLNLSATYQEGFEQMSLAEHKGSAYIGIPGANRWDFTTNKRKGRVRNRVNSAVTITGVQSLSLDNDGNQRYNLSESSFNTVTGTFNLSNYSTNQDEVRCSFDYILHGVPKYDTGNQVWLRGSDNDDWIPLFDYQIDTNNLGLVHPTGSISLSDYLAAAGQQFSTSTQIRLGQFDTSMISTRYFGNGLTMDNFELYTVTDDAQLLALDSVFHYNCSLGNQVPLTLRIRNGVLHTIYDLQVSYQLNGQAPITALIDSIPGKDTLSFTFAELMDLSSIGTHELSAWVHVPTDTYHLNDSILNVQIINQPIIDSFPYLQNFETNDGFFFAEGILNSWEHGIPTAPQINHAASGNKVWKTNLAGHYNNREFSYLYSPCFDISQLQNPMLSFHLAIDIERPGESIFDQAFVEYSNDGHHWYKLGAAGSGTNWYQNDSIQAWTEPGETYWHVASIPLPQSGPVISFRFVLWTDQGATYEGLAIDDVHIFDLQQPIFDELQFTAPISHDLIAGQEVPYVQSGHIGLAVNSRQNLAAVSAQDYKHFNFINTDSSQYYLPKSFLLQSNNSPTDSLLMKFYIPDAAIKSIRTDQTCPSCSQVAEVQQLGISQYSDPEKSKENNLLSDNLNGEYSYVPREQITWIPYDKGYYTIVQLNSFSEYWFNDGGPGRDQHIAADLFDFTAIHQGERAALLEWNSNLNTQMIRYHVQSADTSLQFTTLATITATGGNDQIYQYTDLPVLHESPAIFYRIIYELQNGSSGISIIRRLDWEGHPGSVIVFPNPTHDGNITINWIKGNNESLEWALFSSTGQRVNFGAIEQPYFSGQAHLNLQKLAIAKGLYLLKVRSGKQHWEFKIVYL